MEGRCVLMEIIRGKIPGAKKVVIYGPEGIGKSTFIKTHSNPSNFFWSNSSSKAFLVEVARVELAS